MGIPIQPRDIEVPDQDPFKNDLLERKEAAEILTHLVASLVGPCVIAVDSGWGTGKTTFLRMWAQHLRNKEFPVVEFNAWETDFSGDPFIALSTEMMESLGGSSDKTVEARIERTAKLAKEVVRKSLPGAVRFATAGLLDLEPLLEKEVAQALSSFAENGVSEYQKARKAVGEFKGSLQELAAALGKSNGHRPLVVMIDELDRCRPSYAVQLLEAAKHLFSVDGVVFVLALNRSELAHSIKTLYGGEFDAVGYLRRFFDVDFRLPEPDRAAFIDASLETVRISDYFKRTSDSTARRYGEEEFVQDCLKGFFGSHDFGLRHVSKAIHHLGLMFGLLPSNERSFAISAVVALIVRTVDLGLYLKFVRGEASDLEVVDRVFGRNPGLQKLRKEFVGTVFETIVILAAHEISGDDDTPVQSPLLQSYRQLAGNEGADATAKKHAGEVIAYFDSLSKDTLVMFPSVGRRFGFQYTVQRLELLSPSLIGELPDTPSTES